MNAKVPLAKMEALAQIMLTPTPVPVYLGLLASTAKQTSLIVLKGVYLELYHVLKKTI